MDAEAQKNLIRRRLLGRGLALMRVGDLGRDLTMRADGKDLAIVDGVDNLAQVLSAAVLTPLGGDVFNTDFGFDGLNALVEETEPALTRERVRISVIQLLRKEPRVRQILDVDLDDGRLRPPRGDAPVGPPDSPRADRRRTLTVTVGFETVSLDQTSVRLGTVAPGG